MKAWPLLVVLGCIYLTYSLEEGKGLTPVKWTGGLTKMDDTGRKVYNGISTRAQLHDDFAFLCNPRIKPGMEATLLKRCMFPKDGELCMEPFPPGKPQTEGDCECLQSAVDVYLDPEDTLWVLDVGLTYASHSQTAPKCPPKVFGINIHTGKIEHVINLANMVGPMSRLQFIVADHTSQNNRYLYVADAGTKTIIVWDVAKKKGVRVALPEKVVREYAPLDVLYLALIRKQTGNNLLYFTYRSGDDLFCIESKHLQEDASTSKAWIVGKKPSKQIILGTDDWESIYFRYEPKADVYKWNTSEPFTENNFELVHRANTALIPTHAMPDYKRLLMRIVESNLYSYLGSNAKPAESENSLTVMSITP